MGLPELCRWGLVWLAAGGGLIAQVAPIPSVDEMPGSPYAIRKSWVIGGTGNWDYLTLDSAARQLFVTHQVKVQVVDLDSGNVVGEIAPFGDAHAVALNPNGETGYVSDGRVNKVFFFDRRSFQVTGSVDLPASPRALVFEPATGMLVSLGAMPTPAPPVRNPSRATERPEADPCSTSGSGSPPPPPYGSLISIIDPGKKTRVADVMVCGVLRAAEADGQGSVYFAISNRNEVGRLNASSVIELARNRGSADLSQVHGSIGSDGTLLLDFKFSGDITGSHLRTFPLGRDCRDARAVAVDAPHQRLFAGCANQMLKVIATDTGASIASMVIGPGVETMAYDAGRGLIFTANGGGYGSISIIRQHLTDSYSVIQNLPTMERARTIAIDPTTGLVYLVTTLYGADLRNPPVNGIGTLKLNPVDGSFQVLVVGN